MDRNRARELMVIELDCINRQDTPACCRDTKGCQACPLVQSQAELSEAYRFVIGMLDRYDK